jgi:hypothetical protein
MKTSFFLMILLLLAAPVRAGEPVPGACVVSDPPSYYAIDLVTTKKVPGARMAKGTGQVTYSPSPFGIALTPDGQYLYDLDISVERLKPALKGVYVAWVSTPNLDQVERIGVLDENMQVQGKVGWNKFIVIVTLEPSAEDLGEIWTGPVVVRGLSRSGMMHTMAGHGPFQQEPCAVFGY